MPFTQPHQFLTSAEAAKYLGGNASDKTVTRLIRSGELKGKKVAKGWRILPEWLNEYMDQPDQIQKENK